MCVRLEGGQQVRLCTRSRSAKGRILTPSQQRQLKPVGIFREDAEAESRKGKDVSPIRFLKGHIGCPWHGAC